MSESATIPDRPERWLPVVGHEGLYEVSDLGRVRSLDRDIPCRNRWGGIRMRHYRGQVLRPGLHDFGYHHVEITRDMVSRQRYVHDLVAEAFIGPKPAGMEVCHGPNGPGDNRASQLRYDTRSGNMADCVRDGTDNRGVKNPIAKLNDAAVIDIRRRVGLGRQREAKDQLAKEYGVSYATIGLVVQRKIWKHVA